jgi:predicted nucleic acid-binding protein
MSRQILEEIAAKFIEKGIDEGRVLEFITTVGKLALNVPGNYVVYRLDNIDPDDNMLLAAAQEGSANFLVSLDAQHLLPLKHHMGTQIVNPTLFLRMLERELQSP